MLESAWWKDAAPYGDGDAALAAYAAAEWAARVELEWRPSAATPQPDWALVNAALRNASVLLRIGGNSPEPLSLAGVEAARGHPTWLVLASADYAERSWLGNGKLALVAWADAGRLARVRVQGLELRGRVHVHAGDWIQYVVSYLLLKFF